jgi:hypothetical protein
MGRSATGQKKLCLISPSGYGSVNEVVLTRTFDINVTIVAKCVSVYYFPLRHNNNEVRKMGVQKYQFKTTKEFANFL